VMEFSLHRKALLSVAMTRVNQYRFGGEHGEAQALRTDPVEQVNYDKSHV
jgi:hypothetical protein